MSTTTTTLEKVAIVNLDFSVWCGDAVMHKDEYILGPGGKLPPKKLVKKGRKALLDPKKLTPFKTLKSQTENRLFQIGMRFLNGIAIPVSEIQAASDILNEVKKTLADLKANFASNYDNWCKEWSEDPECVEYKQAIINGKLPLAHVLDRIGFDYQIFNVNPSTDTEAKKMNGLTDGLSEKLMSEVIKLANTFQTEKIIGKDCLSLDSSEALKSLRKKVDGLSFLNPRFSHIIQLIDGALDGYKALAVKNKIYGEGFFRVSHVISIMCSKEQIDKYVSGEIKVDKDFKPTIPASIPKPNQNLSVAKRVSNETQLSLIADDVESFLAQCGVAISPSEATPLTISNDRLEAGHIASSSAAVETSTLVEDNSPDFEYSADGLDSLADIEQGFMFDEDFNHQAVAPVVMPAIKKAGYL